MKVSNLINSSETKNMPISAFETLFQEIIKEFASFGKIKSLFVVRNKNATLGGKHFLLTFYLFS